MTSETEPAAILVALQDLQDRLGYVPADALDDVAAACGVSRAEVHGVLTYYRDLRTSPPSAVTARVCLGEACQAVGARSLRQQAGALASDRVAVDHVYCLGNCALGPASEVNGRLLGRTTLAALSDAVDEALAEVTT